MFDFHGCESCDVYHNEDFSERSSLKRTTIDDGSVQLTDDQIEKKETKTIEKMRKDLSCHAPSRIHHCYHTHEST